MAVVVGIEQYQAGEPWRLTGPALDACRFIQWLTKRGVPADRITALVSPLPENAEAVTQQLRAHRVFNADQSTALKVLTQYLPSQASDLLIVYWGGHGVMDGESRRLIYADATTQNKWNLNLSEFLNCMRSHIFAKHPRQIVLVDACMKLASQLGWETTMPDHKLARGREEPDRDQRVLMAASPGERAANVDALRAGLFSLVLQEELNSLPPGTWPPDADWLRDRVSERFQRLRSKHRTNQVPSYIWFRSRSRENTLFSSGVPAARVSAAAVGGQLLTFAENRRLMAILDGARAPRKLRALYREATRNVLHVGPPDRPDDLMSTIEALRRPLSALPLFRFLVHFAADSDVVTQKKLWGWIEMTAPPWGVDIDELRALRTELDRPTILLQLKPDVLDDGLLLTGWSYTGMDGSQDLAGDEPCDAKRLSAEISGLVRGFDPEQDPVLPIIEFLVPVKMLDDRFDEIEVPIGPEEQAIGGKFPVVVRPLDRAASDAGLEFQRDAWDDLLARCHAYDEDAICWVDPPIPSDPFDPAALQGRVCAALAYPRSSGTSEDLVLTGALAAGFPVAVWHRSSHLRQGQRGVLEEVLRSRALQKLPDVVLGQRSSAGHAEAPPDHAGRDLVLLWDNPYRIPIDRELHPPEQDGVAS
jgi:hypothetical protein